jgi:hypothetical protein
LQQGSAVNKRCLCESRTVNLVSLQGFIREHWSQKSAQKFDSDSHFDNYRDEHPFKGFKPDK